MGLRAMTEWKRAPTAQPDDVALLIDTISGMEVLVAAAALAALAGTVLVRRALRPRRRRLDRVLPYAHAEPD